MVVLLPLLPLLAAADGRLGLCFHTFSYMRPNSKREIFLAISRLMGGMKSRDTLRRPHSMLTNIEKNVLDNNM